MNPSDRLKVRESLFEDLDALGFDRELAQGQHKLIFHKNMFQSTGNTKGMEILMHFLLQKFFGTTRLDSVRLLRFLQCHRSDPKTSLIF